MFLVSLVLVLLSIVLNFKSFEAGVISTTAKTSIETQKPIIEVLCFVDFDTFKLHANEKTGEIADKEVEKYFLPFWKNVDHYFSLLNIGISLKGIIIAHTREEENIFLNSQKNKLFMDAYNSPNTLETFGKYIFLNKNHLPVHDVAIVITQSVLCKEKKNVSQKDSTESSCHANDDVATHLNGICSDTSSVAIIRDENKIYTGVRSAVFAIGQLLGIPKDGENQAKHCKSTDGYFMSGNTLFDSSYKFKWSNCSIEEFENHLKSSTTTNTLSCLFNQSNKQEINFSEVPLPGQILSLDNYCEKLTGYKACSYDDVCSSLTCSYDGNCGRKIKGPAIESSWCGENSTSTMRCSYGKCVPFSFNDNEKYDLLEHMNPIRIMC